MGFNTGLQIYILTIIAFIKGVGASYYYYSYYTVSPAGIGGSIGGSIFGLAILIGICVCCCRRSQGNGGTTIINSTQPSIAVVNNTSHVNPGYGPGYYPDTASQYPGAAPQYPGAVPQYPGAVPQYPGGAAPQYPGGAAPQYPAGAAPQYPGGAAPQQPGNAHYRGTAPQNPGMVTQYPGAIPLQAPKENTTFAGAPPPYVPTPSSAYEQPPTFEALPTYEQISTMTATAPQASTQFQ